ncbi:hypothetical protein BJ508DRAFT_375782 [Ascobolus immersus RN42]|uniref:Uncharacterized protein n=1 Tax=Ascobolus immersus RN42 TaxID=1160509 RepID=A0A3N4I881_ASCIM|nr:hypothetical protein BJ508DRAFT_375782 [Ascobolus immersus RN42]
MPAYSGPWTKPLPEPFQRGDRIYVPDDSDEATYGDYRIFDLDRNYIESGGGRELRKYYDPRDVFTPIAEPPEYSTVVEKLVDALKEEGITSYVHTYCLFRRHRWEVHPRGHEYSELDPKPIETALVLIPSRYKDDAESSVMIGRIEAIGDEAFGATGLTGRTVVSFADIGDYDPVPEDDPREGKGWYMYSVWPGASIGVKGRPSNGTLGLYLKEKREGGAIFGITSALWIAGLLRDDSDSEGPGNEVVPRVPKDVVLEQPSEDDAKKYELIPSYRRFGISNDGLDREFATTTEFSEYGVVDGTYHDYALLKVNRDRFGGNFFSAKDSELPEPPTGRLVDVLASDEPLKRITLPEGGTSSGRAKGTLSSFPALVKLESMNQPLQLTFAYQYGRKATRSRDDATIGAGGVIGSVAVSFGGEREHREQAAAMIVGGVREIDASYSNLRLCFLVDLQEVLERIKARWGLDLQIYDGKK